MNDLIARSARVIVMSEKARDILDRTFNAPAHKVAIIPHGAPDRPLAETGRAKRRLGLEGRDVVLTFGLLSPNKGIESVLRALPRIAAEHPKVLYLILGVTHPRLVAHDGEAYRDGLQRLTRSLGVESNVRFVNAFFETNELLGYITAADIYVTPYLNKSQITSGTLAYAVALGKPVVSTPYWHAEELLHGGAGLLVPFGDSAALGTEISGLLSDEARRGALGARAYAKGRDSIWRKVGARYLEVFEAARRERNATVEPRPIEFPFASLAAVERMSDGCGILQHGRFLVPDRNHGYCVDDNARALILTQRACRSELSGVDLDRLAYVYAGFIEHAWNPLTRRFRNFMAYDRSWLEEAGSDDSFGRALWSLGETAFNGHDGELRRWARRLGAEAMPHLAEIGSPRALAFGILGLCGLVGAGFETARAALRAAADRLHGVYLTARRPDWDWFEPVLAYDNARLPEALLRAGLALNVPEWRRAGLRTLTWLTTIHTSPLGRFQPVGSESFGRFHAPPLPFDQQPLESAAVIDACWAAFDATGRKCWSEEAHRAFGWYLGENDRNLDVAYGEAGGCFDGLGRGGLNRNQGAESILSYQLALCAMLTRAQSGAI